MIRTMRRRPFSFSVSLIWPIAVAAIANAASPITPGDLVVYQTAYDGVSTSDASQVYLDEYTASGTLVQQIPVNSAVPTTSGAGTQFALTGSDSAASEGQISLSSDGQYVAFAGYNAAIGVTSVASSTSATYQRVVGVFNTSTGAVDTSTSLGTVAFSGNNVRGATTADGQNIYAVGTGTSASTNSGIFYAPVGSTTSTQIVRDKDYSISIYNNQLYLVDDGQTTNGVYVVPNQNGTLPTAALSGGSASLSSVALANKENGVSSTTNPEQFAILSLQGSGTADTAYLADSVDGVVEKFTKTGTGTTGSDGLGASAQGFTLSGSVAIPNATGLTATVTPNGVQLYVTTPYVNSTTQSKIFSLLDTSGYGNAITGTPNLLVTGVNAESFKGVVAVPEPTVTSAAVFCGIAGFGAKRRRRSQPV